eukprot:NODE_45_length_27728_cov_0.328387.p3 type:complete len:402 gc:universal NODE_45_length_27728_cov_0.328387:19788-20993(+)
MSHMFPIFLTNKTQLSLGLEFKPNKKRELFTLIPYSTIKSHMEENPLISEFLPLKEELKDIVADLVLIKDIYWTSGQNFIITKDLTRGEPLVETEMINDVKDVKVQQETKRHIRSSKWKLSSVQGSPTLEVHKFQLSAIKSQVVLDKKSFIFNQKHCGSKSHGIQVQSKFTSVKKVQYENSTLSESKIQSITSSAGFLEFCKQAESAIETDLQFQNLIDATRIKNSDVFISNKEKLLDLTSFSLADDSTERKMIATCVRFLPDNHDKIICSFTFLNTSKEDEIILCKWSSKDIITPEQQVLGSIGVTSFCIFCNLIVCGYENGSLKLFDKETLVEKEYLIDKLNKKSPIVYLHYFNWWITAVAMDCSISYWKIHDTQIKLIHEVTVTDVDKSEVPIRLLTC